MENNSVLRGMVWGVLIETVGVVTLIGLVKWMWFIISLV